MLKSTWFLSIEQNYKQNKSNQGKLNLGDRIDKLPTKLEARTIFKK